MTTSQSTSKAPAIIKLDSMIVSIPREVPYLGPLKAGERINEKGYLIRKGNRSIYPASDMSVLIRAEAEDGTVGWGETYGIAAPQAVKAIIDELLAPVVVGRPADTPAVTYEDLYDLMRVRGFFGGYYVDAVAGIDIALWDLFGRIAGQPLAALLGGARRRSIPAYVSGLPGATLDEKIALARTWVDKGFSAFKVAAAVADDLIAEVRALREALGRDIKLMVDLHWKFTAAEAIALIKRLDPFDLAFVEAPCQPEDLEGQAQVARCIAVPLALGEEWRTVYEVRPRLEARCQSILQPEMGHTGVTGFMAIGRLAQAFHVDVIPHASIGIGLFQAASLHAAAALQRVPMHEYQHSIFDRNLHFVTGDMACEQGAFTVPGGPGLGVAPADAVFEYVIAPEISARRDGS